MGSFAPRSVGLAAFAYGKSFSAFPKYLKSQPAQIVMGGVNGWLGEFH
jgi:hypothetical protein